MGYAQTRRQKIVRTLLLDTYGSDLTTLKNLVDFGGDYYNLYLMMANITNRKIRRDIMRHISAEARTVRLKSDGRAVGIKVLSDIDDTLYSSGGKWPAGCDGAAQALHDDLVEANKVLRDAGLGVVGEDFERKVKNVTQHAQGYSSPSMRQNQGEASSFISCGPNLECFENDSETNSMSSSFETDGEPALLLSR